MGDYDAPLLVRVVLGSRDPHVQPTREPQVGDIERDEFGARERPGVAEQQERPVARGGQVVGHRHQDGQEALDEHRIFLLLHHADGCGRSGAGIGARAGGRSEIGDCLLALVDDHR